MPSACLDVIAGVITRVLDLLDMSHALHNRNMLGTLRDYICCSVTLSSTKNSHSTSQHSKAEQSIAPHSRAEQSTAQQSTAPYSTVQHRTAQQSRAEHTTNTALHHKAGGMSLSSQQAPLSAYDIIDFARIKLHRLYQHT